MKPLFLALITLFCPLFADEFCTDSFFQQKMLYRQYFSLTFPEEAKLLDLPEVDQIIYGATDSEGMEYGVTVIPASRVIKPHINAEKLLDAWLAKARKSGEFRVVRKNKFALKGILEGYDLLFIQQEGRAIRGRLIRMPKFIYVLCTRVENSIYLEKSAYDIKNPDHPEAKRDVAKSFDFFNSLMLFGKKTPCEN